MKKRTSVPAKVGGCPPPPRCFRASHRHCTFFLAGNER
nr:MAG TPA: hypothetical protein [Bacteriophage sp.]